MADLTENTPQPEIVIRTNATDIETLVCFRHWAGKHGTVMAIFPRMIGARHGLCGSYEHVGQHGDCEPLGVIRTTRPATPEEYAPLKRELESIGYVLRVITRIPSRYYWWRDANLMKEFMRS